MCDIVGCQLVMLVVCHILPLVHGYVNNLDCVTFMLLCHCTSDVYVGYRSITTYKTEAIMKYELYFAMHLL